jgi:hypothetical protein
MLSTQTNPNILYKRRVLTMNIQHGQTQKQTNANLAFNARLGYDRFKKVEAICNDKRQSQRETLLKACKKGFPVFHKEHCFKYVPKYIRDEVIDNFVISGEVK